MYDRICICSHTPKIVLDSSRMTALDTDSFDTSSMTHALRDFRKVVALFHAVPPDSRSQMLIHTRRRQDSAHLDECRLSASLKPILCPDLVLDPLFLHPEVVFLAVEVFWHRPFPRHVQDSIRIHRHRNVPVASLPFPWSVHR